MMHLRHMKNCSELRSLLALWEIQSGRLCAASHPLTLVRRVVWQQMQDDILSNIGFSPHILDLSNHWLAGNSLTNWAGNQLVCHQSSCFRRDITESMTVLIIQVFSAVL